MGWASKRNGDLLRAAVGAGFEAFVTVDRKLEHQQNLSAFDIAVIVLEAKRSTLADLQPLMPRLLEVLPTAPKRQAILVGSSVARRPTPIRPPRVKRQIFSVRSKSPLDRSLERRSHSPSVRSSFPALVPWRWRGTRHLLRLELRRAKCESRVRTLAA
jgi:hypothetical protein